MQEGIGFFFVFVAPHLIELKNDKQEKVNAKLNELKKAHNKRGLNTYPLNVMYVQCTVYIANLVLCAL